LSELKYVEQKCKCHVILIGPTPEFPDKNEFFSPNRSLLQGSYTPSKSNPKNKMALNPFLDDEFFKKSINGYNLTYLSAIDKFCNSSRCNRFQNSWLYSDYDHLSHSGSEFLVKGLDLKDKLIS
jgi:hypothetical protein